jgi:hypothetical protein
MDEELEWEDMPANGSALFSIESWMNNGDSAIKSLWTWPDPEDVPLHIAICGAGGTEKTRLAESLSENLNIKCIDGIARTVYGLGGKLNKQSAWMDEMMIYLAHLWEQMEYDEFVSAGSLVDVLAYCHYHFADSDVPQDQLLLRALANVTNTIANNDYSVIFYIPLPEKIRGDGVRSVDRRFQSKIDSLVRFYLNAYDLDYFPIQGDTAKERTDIAMSYLSEFGLLNDRN